jgi:energy-coupling factor transport system permease protein
MSIRDITLGRYVHGSSQLHRLDPRTKILSVLLVMTGFLARNAWHPLVAAALFTVLAAALSGLSVSSLLRSLLPFKWFIILTVLLNVLFTGGHILVAAPLPFGGVTLEGVEYGFLFGARIVILVMIASLLTLTTEPVTLVDGVEKLLGPFSRFGVKPHDIAISMVVTIRFIPVLLDEALKIRKSHAARGLRAVGVRANLKSVSILLVPLFASAVRRAEELAIAMDCRLYRSGEPRTRFIELRMAPRDWIALGISTVITAAMFV